MFLEICNFDKYQPSRYKDYKNLKWAAIYNEFWFDMKFWNFTLEEKAVFISLINFVSAEGKNPVFVDKSAYCIQRNFKEKVFDSAIVKLEQLQCIKISVQNLNGAVQNLNGAVQKTALDKIREEKRREEKTPNCTEAKNASIPANKSTIISITDKTYQEKIPSDLFKSWVDTYQDKSWIERELNKAICWIKANPHKSPKRNFQRFFNNWLSRGYEEFRKTLPSNNISGKSKTDIEQILKKQEERKNAIRGI